MRILLTGAAGLVGRAAAPVLRAAGHVVISTDRPGLGADLDAQADLADAAQAASLIGGGRFAAVVHTAAIPRPGQHPPDVLLCNNLMATFNVIEACVGSGVGRLVNISSVGVLGLHYAQRRLLPDYLPIDEDHPLRPQDPYGLAKLFGEQLCDAAVARSELRCISLRPAWVQDAASYATDLGPVIRARPPRGVAGLALCGRHRPGRRDPAGGRERPARARGSLHRGAGHDRRLRPARSLAGREPGLGHRTAPGAPAGRQRHRLGQGAAPARLAGRPRLAGLPDRIR